MRGELHRAAADRIQQEGCAEIQVGEQPFCPAGAMEDPGQQIFKNLSIPQPQSTANVSFVQSDAES